LISLPSSIVPGPKKYPDIFSLPYLAQMVLKSSPKIWMFAGIVFLSVACSSPLVQTVPESLSDTGKVIISCNASEGNRGLMNFKDAVFVHVGLITDSSRFPNDWRYIKFPWGGSDPQSQAVPVDKNEWSYEITNLRQFFGVNSNERILKLAILFRSGNCIDTNCKVLRNANLSDIMIPVNEVKQ